jgi:hypothetical protein
MRLLKPIHRQIQLLTRKSMTRSIYDGGNGVDINYNREKYTLRTPLKYPYIHLRFGIRCSKIGNRPSQFSQL